MSALTAHPVTHSPAPAVGPRLALRPDMDPAVLIGRTHHGLDRAAVAAILTGKRILITGAGGSIGSELARVAAAFNPERLILMERAENALFSIDNQLARRFPGIPRSAVLHDVVDAEHTLEIVCTHRPHVIFHAAAHKHVPLMEDHPSHAVNNNLFGTKAIADAALACGAERFVLISTDKAVNPTSVMGATKRLAEMYVSSLAAGPTCFSMVRFGNVLASACSVIPIWAAQLADGAPITITDPRMTRYFMTIPEAATLVAQAAALSSDPTSAPLYVLDMGEPVRILDLALRFVRLSGYQPRVRTDTLPPGTQLPVTLDAPIDLAAPTVDIVFSGIRPGEKLFEQLAYEAENLAPTTHPGIGSWKMGNPGATPAGTQAITHMIDDMASVRRWGGADQTGRVLELLRKHVPEMRGAA
ncbi:MAG: polysaccharide biosynthesis protein [Phycisphaerales bacterium]